MNEEDKKYLDLVAFEDALTKLAEATEPADVALAVQDIRESYSALFVQAETALRETELVNEKYVKTIKALGELTTRLSTAPIVEVVDAVDIVEDAEEVIEEVLFEDEDEIEDFSAAFL